LGLLIKKIILKDILIEPLSACVFGLVEVFLFELKKEEKAMALISCPDCGNEVSSNAVACPKCGYPIASAPMTEKKIVVAKEGCFLQTLNLGCLIIFAIIGLFVLLIFFSNKS
jgi:hypothetical protein